MSAETTNNTDADYADLDLILEAADGKVVETEHPAGIPMNEWVFTNDKTNPHIRQQFHLYMKACFQNSIGLMHAKDKTTGEIQTLIVGVESTEDGLVTYPLAKVLMPDEQNNYLAPTGDGGYLGGD